MRLCVSSDGPALLLADGAVTSHMHLFEHPLSSYAQKVKIALREKGIAFTLELPETFGTGITTGPFATANPRTEVPTLVTDAGDAIFNSTIILDFIDESWPAPPLMPAFPLARAAARMIEDVCDTHYEAVNWGFAEILWFRRAEGGLAETLRARAAAQTRQLQAWLSERLGDQDWFGGGSFGRADLAVAPVLNRSVHYGMGPEPGSRLQLWHVRVSARPAVAETFAEFDGAAGRMAAASDLYTTGGRRREYRDHRLEWMVKSGGIEIVLEGLRRNTIRFPWPDA